ncbi:hypothetical protein Q8F55_005062 [Vanrija albida]|uniref:non-specific serine/threonine protein kinase n=1 Tax=Vanrija albida TaxID=181172 RepID=A0ABR3Q189_9TREE
MLPTPSSSSRAALKSAIAPASSIPTPDTSGDDLKNGGESPPRPSWSRSRPIMPELSDFELVRVLGKGCAGRVLLVKHTPTSRVHAMKAISKRAVLANDELDHTLAEQHILQHFAMSERRSAFISRLYYSFTDKENFYLVMEFYPGGDLATQMEIHGILGPLRTRFYTCDIVAGLEHLHREGILVRDLKPENILLNWHGHAVLADFGLSKSFGYRGDPVPVKLPADYIDGKGDPPPHAGKGFGSYRKGELTWDRAFSFVGTQEYLAPEVIKRNHYTYAIDWWALGCIVCECLTGRVPFRGSDSESNAELYERVIHAPWDALYRGDHPKIYLKERYRIDLTTYDFIDGLLAKEPMFRLTEPCVKSHAYFTNVDWDTVDKGDYQDPFQLEIDPVAEYNTQFFPRLCLEETPTVDMRGHDYGKDPDDASNNPLNNDDVYAAAQEEFRNELASFDWTCQNAYDIDDNFDDQDEDDQLVEEDLYAVDNASVEQSHTNLSTPEITNNQDSIVSEDTVRTPTPPLELASAKDQTPPTSPSPVPTLVDTPRRAELTDAVKPEAVLVDKVVEPTPPPLASPPTSPRSPVAAPDILSEPLSPPPAIQTPLPASPPTLGPINTSPIPTVEVHDLSAPPLVTTDAHGLSISPHQSPSGLSVRLPSGPPSGGLSVSDVISVPGSPNLIIRRHRQAPSIDAYPHHPRLSVEVNGIISQLGDEDWEQLDAETIPEAPNGADAAGQTRPSLLARVGMLGRRPSVRGLASRQSSAVRVPSGLRKGVSAESDTSSEQSSNKGRQPLFATRGYENTKKALIKAFPPAQRRPSSDNVRPATPTSTSPSPVASIRAVVPITPAPQGTLPKSSSMRESSLREPDAPSTSKRTSVLSAFSSSKRTSSRSGDLGLLFSRPKSRKGKERRARTMAPGGSSSWSTPVAEAAADVPVLPSIPRIELIETPPIVWELDADKASK